MKVELRNDHMIIEGYVNAVERYSKEITENGRTFTEKITAGAFKEALNTNKDVKLLFNHNENRVLASQSDFTLDLDEDNIGLRAKAVIRDLDIIDEAKKGHLTGWSFGFNCLEDSWEGEKRSIKSLYLHEVSLLNVEPAYIGTSIEIRNLNDNLKLEIRCSDDLQIENNEDKINIEDTEQYQELNRFLQRQHLFIT